MISISFTLDGCNNNDNACVKIFGKSHMLKNINNTLNETIEFSSIFFPLYYIYTKTESSNKIVYERRKYRSIIFDEKTKFEYIQTIPIKINVFDKWDDNRSAFNPVIKPISISDNIFYFIYTTESDISPSFQIKYGYQQIKKAKDHYECNFKIRNQLDFVIPELLKIQCNKMESYFCRINTGIFKQRYASIYLPLISFKSRSQDCDVGTFSSIEKLIDFCNTCGIYQIILDIEKVNDYFTFDPIHIDTNFETKELTTYDIDSIRNLKKAALLEKKQDFDKTKYSAFKEYYSEYITDPKNENLVFSQYMCYSQLHKAYLYACKKNISIATIIYNKDKETEKKVSMASQFSHSIYICNPFNEKVDIESYKKIDDYGLTIMVDSSIANKIKSENFSFIFPCEYKDDLISENKSFGTFMGPNSLKPSLISEFPSEKSRKDIKHAIEDRIYSDEDVSIFYLTDLLYITLPGAERDIYQPLKGKITEGKEYWRYLYNFTVDDLIKDPNVVAKTKELLINGNRYYEGEIDKY